MLFPPGSLGNWIIQPAGVESTGGIALRWSHCEAAENSFDPARLAVRSFQVVQEGWPWSKHNISAHAQHCRVAARFRCFQLSVALAGITFTLLWLLQCKRKYSLSGLSCVPLFIWSVALHPLVGELCRAHPSHGGWIRDELALGWTPAPTLNSWTATSSKSHQSEPAFLKQSNFPLASLEMEIQKEFQIKRNSWACPYRSNIQNCLKISGWDALTGKLSSVLR